MILLIDFGNLVQIVESDGIWRTQKCFIFWIHWWKLKIDIIPYRNHQKDETYYIYIYFLSPCINVVPWSFFHFEKSNKENDVSRWLLAMSDKPLIFGLIKTYQRTIPLCSSIHSRTLDLHIFPTIVTGFFNTGQLKKSVDFFGKAHVVFFPFSSPKPKKEIVFFPDRNLATDRSHISTWISPKSPWSTDLVKDDVSGRVATDVVLMWVSWSRWGAFSSWFMDEVVWFFRGMNDVMMTLFDQIWVFPKIGVPQNV